MSFELSIDPNVDKPERYRQLAESAAALLADEPDLIANAANFAALIYSGLPNLNWAGFYFLKDDELVVGPFQGLPACVRIPLGKGVCGTAASRRETQLVADVNSFPGHIACDSASRSEIVVPIIVGQELLGVFDVDSPEPDHFDGEDQRGLEALVEVFVHAIRA
jgi:GAF domain-containing protein